MTKLELTIFERGINYRKGRLFMNGKEVCTTIERVEGWLHQHDLLVDIQNTKARLKCAIPYGIYTVQLLWSDKFKRVVPHVLNVPGWDAIEIHIGNQSTESEGCILVGISDQPDTNWVSNSNIAFNLLMSYLNDLDVNEITIELKEK